MQSCVIEASLDENTTFHNTYMNLHFSYFT
jgi:hypothetical protein